MRQRGTKGSGARKAGPGAVFKKIWFIKYRGARKGRGARKAVPRGDGAWG